METAMRLSKGKRRHIRNQKSAIRRQFGDTPESREKIRTLVSSFFNPVKTEPKQEKEVETPVSEKPKKKAKKTK